MPERQLLGLFCPHRSLSTSKFLFLTTHSQPARTLPLRQLTSPKFWTRPASQWGPRRPQYNRFSNAQNIYNLWQTSNNFRVGIGAAGLGFASFYVYNLEEVPISGRRRFNFYSAEREEARAKEHYLAVLREYGKQVLPPQHPSSRLVNSVMTRLIPAAGLEGQDWEVRVINDPDQKNAFVIPGVRTSDSLPDGLGFGPQNMFLTN